LLVCAALQCAAYCNYFADGFTRADGVGTWHAMSWLNADWDTVGDRASYCSNTTWYVRPGGGQWNWCGIRPAGTFYDECAFDVVAGDVTLQLDVGAWSVFDVTNAADFDAHLSMALLSQPVTANPWDLAATGLILRARLDINADPSSNLTLYLSRKYKSNDDGLELFSTNVAHTPGAPLTLVFGLTAARVLYQGAALFNGAHDVLVGDWPNWYPGFVVQNVAGARANYFFDNALVTGAGAGYTPYCADEFTQPDGSPVHSDRWCNVTGTAVITNNACLLTPGAWDWAGANLNPKADRDNMLRLEPAAPLLRLRLRLRALVFTSANAGGPTHMLKTEWYPERNNDNSYNYNAFSLSVETLCTLVDDATTNLSIQAYLYDRAANRIELFASNDVAFMPDAVLAFELDQTNLTAWYNSSMVGAALHDPPLSARYPRGVFPALRVENYGAGRGAVLLDDVLLEDVPEPATALWLVLAAGMVRATRRWT
jgi:hypothetical protein